MSHLPQVSKLISTLKQQHWIPISSFPYHTLCILITCRSFIIFDSVWQHIFHRRKHSLFSLTINKSWKMRRSWINSSHSSFVLICFVFQLPEMTHKIECKLSVLRKKTFKFTRLTHIFLLFISQRTFFSQSIVLIFTI